MSSSNEEVPEDEYIFGRDTKSSIRLNYQHFWTTNLVKFHMHPIISLSKSNVYIADIGTGTGIWPIGISQHLPLSSSIHGFDISSAQFPPKDWLPANVWLHTQDAFAEWPAEWHGRFDVVNVRFMITLLGNREAFERLMGNVGVLLKPSGHIQWLDLYPPSIHTLPPPQPSSSNSNPPHNPTTQSATEKVVLLMRQPHSSTDYSYLTTLCASPPPLPFPYTPLAHSRIPITPAFRTLWNQSTLLGVEEAAGKMEAEKAVRAREMLRELGKEFEEGWSVGAEYFVWVVRKEE